MWNSAGRIPPPARQSSNTKVTAWSHERRPAPATRRDAHVPALQVDGAGERERLSGLPAPSALQPADAERGRDRLRSPAGRGHRATQAARRTLRILRGARDRQRARRADHTPGRRCRPAAAGRSPPLQRLGQSGTRARVSQPQRTLGCSDRWRGLTMMTVRPASERGHAQHGWLDSWHSFSFADYRDPRHVHFGPLRVINEDRVKAGGGFGPHPHQDMQILSYVLAGELRQRDSLGNGSIIRPGDMQRMSAGPGVSHSEFNPSQTAAVHFLQIWIEPAVRGVAPEYEQRHVSAAARRGPLRLIASPDGPAQSPRTPPAAPGYPRPPAR